jgi:hypothetical protein
VLLGLLVLGSIVWHFLPAKAERAAKSISVGMTRKEVRKILGVGGMHSPHVEIYSFSDGTSLWIGFKHKIVTDIQACPPAIMHAIEDLYGEEEKDDDKVE